MSDWNDGIITEFRENDGHAGGWFEGKPLLLLHHTGAKSGTKRVTPLMYHEDDGDIFVFASKAGSPTNPDWYHNLKAHPQAAVEIGTETRPVEAREVVGPERDAIYARHAARFSNFAEYQEKTDRVIPVFRLAG